MKSLGEVEVFKKTGVRNGKKKPCMKTLLNLNDVREICIPSDYPPTTTKVRKQNIT